MKPSTTTQDQPETLAEQGSSPLHNPQWEQFAQRASWGVSLTQAYILAGYKDGDGVSNNASRLAKKPGVADRIAWLKAQVASAMVYDARKIKERLAYMADALTEIRIDPATGDRRPGPMFNAQAGARVMELLGRAEGVFKDKIELGGQVSVGNREVFEKMTPDERVAFRAMLTAAASRTPPRPANDDAAGGDAPSGVVPVAK